MDEETMKNLHKIVNGPDWAVVNAIIERHVARLSMIAGLDLSSQSDDLKMELRARDMAKEILDEILCEMRGYGLQERSVSPLTRSLR